MNIIDLIKPGNDVVILAPVDYKLTQDTPPEATIKVVNSSSDFSDLKANSYDIVLLENDYQDETQKIYSECLQKIKPGGVFIINGVLVGDPTQTELVLKTTGFVNVEISKSHVASIKPKYEIGSSVKLNLKKPQTIWKLDDEEDDEIIDPDNLLDDDDIKKPDPASLRVCGTTGKRKACKDCSCGLAEELATEGQKGKVIDTTDAPKSSCGSCYLGDAFRCASCPYLGMPAFKPGEKIQLTDDLLKSDI